MGLPLCDKHSKLLELKEVVLYDEEATGRSTPDHCWVCKEWTQMNDLKNSAILILLVGVLTAYQAFIILTSRTYQLTEHARATQLVVGCELWDVVPPSQTTRTVVLACPGVDAIRLWPLPVQQPWEEEQLILATYVDSP
jgi:hypothetical protein